MKLNEDLLATTLAKEIQEEIDWEVMCELMTEIGWHKIQMPVSWSSMTSEFQYEVKHWTSNNMKGNYKARGRTWLFEKEKDAILFSLRWSS